MNKSDIKLIQHSLKETVAADIKVDGIWGKNTADAVDVFAKAFNINADEALKQLMRYANTRFVNDDAFAEAAKMLNVKESYVRAIAEVESAGESFLKDGRVKILFERHKFWLYLKETLLTTESARKVVASILALPATSSADTLLNAVVKRYPNICNPETGGYIGGSAEWDRIGTAMTIHIEAACKSASYGGYQLMGFNHQLCGYTTAREMMLALAISESAQFMAAIRFIKANPTMHAALRAADWATFARGYNGKGYAANHYDTRLRDAESKWAKLS